MGYASDVEDLSTLIETNIAALNSAAASANSATTQASYDAYVAAYNEAKANYDENLGEYDEALDAYVRYVSVSRVGTFLADVPNIKDKNQNMAGGEFGVNGALPGGVTWSPTATPNMKVGSPSVDHNANLMNGNMLSYLNYGFGTISQIVMGGDLDLMFDDKVRITDVQTVTVTITIQAEDGTLLKTITADISYDGQGISGSDNFSSATEYASNTDIASMMAGSWSMSSMANIGGLFSFSTDSSLSSLRSLSNMLAIVSIAGKVGSTESFEQAISAGVYGTVMGTITSAATNAAIGALGINTATVAGFTAASVIGLGIGTLAQEAFEVAVGYDNHFGPGGEFIGVGADGVDQFGTSQSFGSYLGDQLGQFGEMIGFGDYVTQREMEVADYNASMAADGLGTNYSFSKEVAEPTWDEIYAQNVAQTYAEYTANVQNTFGLSDEQMANMGYDGYGDVGGVNDNNAGGWGDGGTNNSDGMGNNSNDTSGVGDQSASEGGYGDGNGGFGGI